MKIRTDFVTNSSSSSFILAYKNDVTKEDITNALKTKESQIKSNIEDWNDWRDEEATYEEVLESLVNSLMDYKTYGMNLENWSVYSQEYSNEDDLEDFIIYSSLGNVDTEKFKIKES